MPLQEFFTSLTLTQQVMLGSIVGALVTIPVKDVLSVGYYDICDVFFSTFFTALLLEAMGKEDGMDKLVMGAMFIGISMVIIFLKIVLIVPFQEKAETTALMSREDYVGETGKVTVAIKGDALGEVVIYTPFGNATMTAKIYHGFEAEKMPKIATGEPVRVMDVEGSIVYVEPYTATTFLPPLKSSWGKRNKR